MQNGEMPRYAQPSPALPPDVERVASMLGINRVRLHVLRQLQQHPTGATTGTLADELKLPAVTVVRHIRALEDEAVVVSDTTERTGTRVRYRLHSPALTARLADLQRYLASPQ